MALTIQKTILSFLSTAMFFATFLIAGDILVAAVVAIFTAVIQFVIRQSAFRNKSALIWASLAIVLALTGLSLKGDDAAASSLAPTASSNAVAYCTCQVPAHTLQATLTTAQAL